MDGSNYNYLKSPSIGRLLIVFINSMINNIKVLSFGEIIFDEYDNEKTLGGAPLNFSVHAAKCGAKVYLLSVVGDDELGKAALNSISRTGVDCRYISKSKLPTGRCLVKLNESGVPEYNILNNVAYDDIADIDEVYVNNFDILYFGTLAVRNNNNFAVVKKLVSSANIGKVFCDLNLRQPFFNDETIEFCLKTANIIKVSDSEFEYVFKKVLNVCNIEDGISKLSLKYKNIEQVVLTCGENGAYAYCLKEGKTYFEPAKKVKVLSTVGAGDCFSANYLVNYLNGEPVRTCLKKATIASAEVVGSKNAF